MSLLLDWYITYTLCCQSSSQLNQQKAKAIKTGNASCICPCSIDWNIKTEYSDNLMKLNVFSKMVFYFYSSVLKYRHPYFYFYRLDSIVVCWHGSSEQYAWHSVLQMGSKFVSLQYFDCFWNILYCVHSKNLPKVIPNISCLLSA